MIIVDGFTCREKALHAEKLSAALGWKKEKPLFIRENRPYWDYTDAWDIDYQDNTIIDGFVAESWSQHGNILSKKLLTLTAKIQTILYCRDDLRYLWVVTADQCRSRSRVIERMVAVSGISFTVLDDNGNAVSYAPPGTWQQKVRRRTDHPFYPSDDWWVIA